MSPEIFWNLGTMSGTADSVRCRRSRAGGRGLHFFRFYLELGPFVEINNEMHARDRGFVERKHSGSPAEIDKNASVRPGENGLSAADPRRSGAFGEEESSVNLIRPTTGALLVKDRLISAWRFCRRPLSGRFSTFSWIKIFLRKRKVQPMLLAWILCLCHKSCVCIYNKFIFNSKLFS